MADPVVQWPGGKRQLMDNIKRRFPVNFGTYYEPFIGGGAVFFNLEPDDSHINDTNPRLINLYRQVRDRPDKVISRLKEYDHPESEPDPDMRFSEEDRGGKEINEYYYQQRARFNSRPYDNEMPLGEQGGVEEAALFLYLNRTCFNALYRENSDGGFNAPIGNYDNPDWVNSGKIRKASRVLQSTTITNFDYKRALRKVSEGDLVYLDPPYAPMSPTANFNDYSQEGFGKEEQKELMEVFHELHKRGAYFIVSNSGVMYDQYEDLGMNIKRVGAKRTINSDGENRGEVDEVLGTNLPEDRWRGGVQSGLGDF